MTISHPIPARNAAATLQPPTGSTLPVEVLRIYDVVRSTGKYNFMGSRCSLPQPLHIPLWRQELRGYHDVGLVEYLQYGWPIGYTAPDFPAGEGNQKANHHSALAHPMHVDKYIQKELAHGALLGPFSAPPFLQCHISPLMTRPKKDSQDRRVIVDLSFPHGTSVNDGIPREHYLGDCYKLQYPGVDNLVSLVIAHGQGSHMYKVDLERAYRHFRCDVSSYPLLGIEWNKEYYIDISIPFGLRTGALICQKVTNAFVYIMSKYGIDLVNYIDDIAGCNAPDAAQDDYSLVRAKAKALGLREAPHKLCHPCTSMVFLGINFDSVALTLKIPADKVQEVLQLLQQWQHRRTASRHQLQSLLGKLHHVAKCVRPARLFVSRMLETLRVAPPSGQTVLSEEFQMDLHWFLQFMPRTNGISMMVHPNLELMTGHSAHLDACLSGCGAVYGQLCYAAPFPDFILQEQHPIHCTEMLNVVVAARLWGRLWARSSVTLYLDNIACVQVLESGRSRDRFLLQCAREVWLCSAQWDFLVHARHTPGRLNVLADALSRRHTNPARYDTIIAGQAPNGLYFEPVAPELFKFSYAI